MKWLIHSSHLTPMNYSLHDGTGSSMLNIIAFLYRLVYTYWWTSELNQQLYDQILLFQFFNRMSSSKSSNIIVLILAQIMGMYFISSVLLLRMNMPVQYRAIITQVLGALQFNFYHRWFDVIFLVSALGSIVTLYLAHKEPIKENSWSP